MFKFDLNKTTYKNIFFIGIGGISMSGLAEILVNHGFNVSGSDSKKSTTTDHLEKLGINIYIGHNKKNIQNQDLVVYTDAISENNAELLEAKNKKIKMVDRATFLGAIMKNYKKSIAISGTHGKTSTTSMLASMSNNIDYFNPTILLGGNLNEIGGNIKIAGNDCIITEACEYKANITKYYPTTALILNIDEDHLDYFKDINHIIDTFKKYTNNIQRNGNLIINIDDTNNREVIKYVKKYRKDINIYTFGQDLNSDFRIINISFNHGKTDFILMHKHNKYDISLQVMGLHNVYNATASIIASILHDISFDDIITNIKKYKGVKRRLEYKGEIDSITIFDDYAHHPTEIKTTLKAIENIDKKGKTYCIFQPHTYTRTKILLDSFSKSFINVDEVIITDIYAAREVDNGSIHSKDLVDAVNKVSKNATYINNFENVEKYLNSKLTNGDLVITMGAGDVFQLGENLINNRNKVVV